MRANGRDITELFGYCPDDRSSIATDATNKSYCTFIDRDCTKTNHDKSIKYGVCSVSHGILKDAGSEVIICPNRLYADSYKILQNAIDAAWPDRGYQLIVGGNFENLTSKAKSSPNPAVAFGHNSGNEISVNSYGKMSMDWVIQTYDSSNGLNPKEFIGIEVQSIDITGNYRENREAYVNYRQGNSIGSVADSGHGLNWANVHKRLIPQIIRKGNIYRKCDRCSGFFFLVPESVYLKFEALLGNLPRAVEPSKETLTVMTYGLGGHVSDGQIRPLKQMRCLHIPFQIFAESVAKSTDPKAPIELDEKLQTLL